MTFFSQNLLKTGKSCPSKLLALESEAISSPFEFDNEHMSKSDSPIHAHATLLLSIFTSASHKRTILQLLNIKPHITLPASFATSLIHKELSYRAINL